MELYGAAGYDPQAMEKHLQCVKVVMCAFYINFHVSFRVPRQKQGIDSELLFDVNAGTSECGKATNDK